MGDNAMLQSNGMIRSRRRVLSSIALSSILFGSSLALAPFAQAFESPLDVAAMPSARLASSPLLAMFNTGSRLVAVGLRGSIIVSEDQGHTWTQAKVPVSVDLVAISFPSAKQGWAVGHGGVVLHSEDGGLTWQKQLDGLQASKLAVDFYTRNPEQLTNAEELLTKEQNLAVDKETQPFLDVYFSDDQHGYVVGTFNRIFATSDGGKSWAPQMHLTDNPKEWHFYSINGKDGQLYLSGEQGHVWRHDPHSNHFVSVDTPYNGTLFGVLATDNGQLYAYGMRGSFFRSSDQGLNWQRSQLPFNSNVVRVLALDAGHLLLVGQNGEIARSSDGGQTFTLLTMRDSMPYFGAALLGKSQLALVGALGVRIESI